MFDYTIPNSTPAETTVAATVPATVTIVRKSPALPKWVIWAVLVLTALAVAAVFQIVGSVAADRGQHGCEAGTHAVEIGAGAGYCTK